MTSYVYSIRDMTKELFANKKNTENRTHSQSTHCACLELERCSGSGRTGLVLRREIARERQIPFVGPSSENEFDFQKVHIGSFVSIMQYVRFGNHLTNLVPMDHAHTTTTCMTASLQHQVTHTASYTHRLGRMMLNVPLQTKCRTFTTTYALVHINRQDVFQKVLITIRNTETMCTF